jgi:uncharacterized protein (TIGR03083 family)
MTQITDRVIAALRHNHETLVALLPNLSEEQLRGPSGASEWSIAQVLSHLGSGAEITRVPIARAAGADLPEPDNQAIWARWDAAEPLDQAAGYVEHDAAYLETVEALTPEQRDRLMVDLGFLPEPVPLLVALAMRLNEVANHAWDVRVGLDPKAGVDEESAELLVQLFAGPLAFLLGFSGKSDQVDEPVRLAVPGGGIEITDRIAVTTDLDDPTATFEAPVEAVVRLLSGRLRDEHAEGVSVRGNVGLDDLRKVFPGY